MINKPIVLRILLTYSQAQSIMLQLREKILNEKKDKYDTTPEPEVSSFKKFKEDHPE